MSAHSSHAWTTAEAYKGFGLIQRPSVSAREALSWTSTPFPSGSDGLPLSGLGIRSP